MRDQRRWRLNATKTHARYMGVTCYIVPTQFLSSSWCDGQTDGWTEDGEESDVRVYSENRARGDGDLGANAFVDRVNPD